MKRPERVMIVHPGPEFSVADVYAGWMEGLIHAGIRVAEYNMNDRLVFYASSYVLTGKEDDQGHQQFQKALDAQQAMLLAAQGVYGACYQFWPQVVLIVSGFFTPPGLIDVLKDRGHKVVLLHTESPYQDGEQLVRAASADLNLINDPANIDKYQALGVPVAYMPHAYRPSIHSIGPGAVELESDFAFVGTGFPSRVEFFERMHELGAFDGIDVCLAGNWQATREDSPLRKLLSHDLEECTDNVLTAQIYKASKVGLNMYRQETEDNGSAAGVALGPREVEMAACGLFFLRDARQESDDVLWMLPTYEGPEDATEQLRWWLDHESQRGEVALKARQAIRPRTFGNNVKRLLELLADL